MIRYTRLLRSTILDSIEGEILGKVVDIVYSNNLQNISSIIVESGILKKNKWLIPYNDIVSFKEDKVLVYKDNYLNIEELKTGKLIFGDDVKIIEKEVLKEDGELIGYVKDVIINPSNGMLVGFIMTEGIFEEIFRGRNFIPSMEDIKINGKNIVIDNVIMDQIVKNKDYYKKLLEFEDD